MNNSVGKPKMHYSDVAKMIVSDENKIVNALTKDSIMIYEYLQKTYRNVNIAADMEFRKKFSNFYIMRYPKQKYRDAFFGVFEKNKAYSCPSFKLISEELYMIDGKHQFSFITKMIHTISGNHPIFDSKVAAVLGINRLHKPFEEALKRDEMILDYLKDTYNKINNENLIDSAIALFDRKFPANTLSFAKKIDFCLWSKGALKG